MKVISKSPLDTEPGTNLNMTIPVLLSADNKSFAQNMQKNNNNNNKKKKEDLFLQHLDSAKHNRIYIDPIYNEH